MNQYTIQQVLERVEIRVCIDIVNGVEGIEETKRMKTYGEIMDDAKRVRNEIGDIVGCEMTGLMTMYECATGEYANIFRKRREWHSTYSMEVRGEYTLGYNVLLECDIETNIVVKNKSGGDIKVKMVYGNGDGFAKFTKGYDGYASDKFNDETFINVLGMYVLGMGYAVRLYLQITGNYNFFDDISVTSDKCYVQNSIRRKMAQKPCMSNDDVIITSKNIMALKYE